MMFEFPIEKPTTRQAVCDLLNAFSGYCEATYGKEGLEASYGFGHIVVDDFNLYDSNLDFCIGYFQEWVQDRMPRWKNDWFTMHRALLVAAEVVYLLMWLKWIPESMRVEEGE